MTAPELELHAVMSPLILMLGPLEELQMFPATRALSPSPRCSFFSRIGCRRMGPGENVCLGYLLFLERVWGWGGCWESHPGPSLYKHSEVSPVSFIL